MFLYNILVGGSSKQQLHKHDKITFKINLNDNVPQFYECTPSESNKPYQYEEDQELTPNHSMYNKIISFISKKGRKSSFDSKASSENHENNQETEQQNNKQPRKKSQGIQGELKGNIQTQYETLVQDDQEEQPQSDPQEKHYHIYTTTQNDSLFGLALKLDIRQQQIQQINGIGTSIYPGMRIKLPLYCDMNKLYDQPEEPLSKVKISELLGTQTGILAETQKFDVQYFTGIAGYIKGTLSVNNNYIIFNPNLQDKTNLENYSIEKLLKFNAIVETMDIQSIEFIDIPQMAESDSKIEDPDHNYIIQIFLYIVGNSKIQKKYKDRLNKLKAQKKAIASISFSLRSYKAEGKPICEKIISKIKQIIQKHHQNAGQSSPIKSTEKLNDQKHLTNIPFFDIIHENLHPKMKEQIQSIVVSPLKKSQQDESELKIQPVSPSLICGILTETSDVISDSQFHNLSFALPLLYQQCNWTRIYSSTTNGTSFTTLLNKSKNQYPLILLVKEYKGWKFGAFLCESLETGKTGRGEMFLFTFKNESEVPDIYKWTGKNEFFVYIEKESGIGIGMGVKYGLFLKSTLDKGSSSSTFTFGNSEGLSKKEDFTVEEVELWAVDNGY